MRSSKFKVRSSKRDDPSPPLYASAFELRASNFGLRVHAFTLVEMMVVVAIIALLLAALLPAFSAVRNQAKLAQASAQFKALDTGINAFRAEAALGGSLPPSSTDGDDSPHSQKIADPKKTDPNTKIRVAGAHLLVHAMIGADGLGTPGFRDVNHDSKGLWSDDTHSKPDQDPKKCGIYAIDDKGKEKFPRYGGSGYVDEKMKERVESIQDQVNEGKVLPRDFGDVAVNEGMFMDPWDHPILYYKANPTSLRMTAKTDASPPKPGIYWQEDNGIITGTDKGLFSDGGLDFGQGKEANYYHNIAVAAGPDSSVAQNANWMDTFRADPQYDHSFAKFILDGSVKARATPVQKDTYLLISAGPDSRYGTDDDVLNWTRKTD